MLEGRPFGQRVESVMVMRWRVVGRSRVMDKVYAAKNSHCTTPVGQGHSTGGIGFARLSQILEQFLAGGTPQALLLRNHQMADNDKCCFSISFVQVPTAITGRPTRLLIRAENTFIDIGA